MGRENYSTLSSNLADEGYNSASSQFVILEKEAKSLNGMYAAFAEVVEGKEAIDKLYERPVQENTEENSSSNSSGDDIQKFSSFKKITNVKVETYGIDYGTPVVQEKFDYQAYMQQLYSQYYQTQ